MDGGGGQGSCSPPSDGLGGRPQRPADGHSFWRSAPSVRRSRRPTDGRRPWDRRMCPDVRRTWPWTSGRVTTLSAMSPFIEEFQNPFSDRPSITEMEKNYGSLWQLKNCIIGWIMGVSRHNGYVHLLHKEANSSAFL
jgi:hypothetical protein